MASKPTYDCAYSILKHMDLKKRLGLKAKSPVFRQLESTIPLEIDVLDFSGTQVLVNEVEYSIGIVQKWPTDKIPDWAKLDRLAGPIQEDIDEYGRPLMPGDINLTGRGRIPVESPSEQIKDLPVNLDNLNAEIEEIKKSIQENKKKLADLRLRWGTYPFTLKELNEFKNRQGHVYFHKAEEPFLRDERRRGIYREYPRHRFQERQNYQSRRFSRGREEGSSCEALEKIENKQDAEICQKELDLEIFESQKEIHRLIHIRDNTLPEFRVQLVIKEPSGEEQIKYAKYNRKLLEYHKGLIDFMFGNRRSSIKVKKLIVSHENFIRAPIGLKLKVQGLKIISRKDHFPRLEGVLNRLRPIFDESSIPLKSIEFESRRIEDFHHEMIMSAKEVIIRWKHNPLTMINVDLPHQRVIAEVYYLEPEHYIDFVQRLKDAGRPIGTHHSFIINDGPPNEIFKAFQNNVIREGEKFVVIPFNEKANLKVSLDSRNQISFEVIGLFG
uniref:Piwi domain-containing protein n=1 Tax=Caenorhabditis tropicalis TaxID=1561998 RepID=A0A1I7TAG3_9PELO